MPSKPLRRSGRLILTLILVGAITGAIYRHRWNPLFDRLNEIRVGRSLVTAAPLLAGDTTVVFMFRSQDCPSAKGLIAGLDSLSRTGRPVAAALVGDSASIPGWRDVLSSSGVTFPSMLIPALQAAVIVRRLNRGFTPALVVYDRISKRFRPADARLATWLRARASSD